MAGGGGGGASGAANGPWRGRNDSTWERTDRERQLADLEESALRAADSALEGYEVPTGSRRNLAPDFLPTGQTEPFIPHLGKGSGAVLGGYGVSKEVEVFGLDPSVTEEITRAAHIAKMEQIQPDSGE